ncbi:MAG: DMT family transporter [Hyphomicrobiaceae bacterium]
MNAALLGLVAAFGWGLHDFIGRFASRRVGTGGTTLSVMVSGFLLLTVWTLGSGIPPMPGGRELMLVGFTGVVYALALILLFAALSCGPLSLVSVVVAAYPASIVAFHILGGERPGPVTWIAMAAVLAGTLLVVGAAGQAVRRADEAPYQIGRATLLSILSHLSFAASLSAGQTVAPLLGDVEATWLARAAGLGLVGVFCLRDRPSPAATMRWLPALAVMGALDVIALGAILTAGSYDHPQLAPVVSSGYGAVAVVLALVFLKEPVAPFQWLGIALVVAGSAVLSAGLG